MLAEQLKQIKEACPTINAGGCGYAALIISDMLTRVGIAHKIEAVEQAGLWVFCNPFVSVRREVKFYGASFDQAINKWVDMHKLTGRAPSNMWSHIIIRVGNEHFDASGSVDMEGWVRKGTMKRETLLRLVRERDLWNPDFEREPGRVQTIVKQIETLLQKSVR